MRVLGIDPGYATVGYGILDWDGRHFSLVGYGAVTTAPEIDISLRLCEIHNDITELIERFKPDEIAIEELFFNTNVKTAIQVGQARGVILQCCASMGKVPFEYTPLQVKQAVVGYGRAEKRQVMEMTRAILKMNKIPKPDDAADALAIAVCHCHSRKTGKKFGFC